MNRRPSVSARLSESSCGHDDRRWKARLAALSRQQKWVEQQLAEIDRKREPLLADLERVAARITTARAFLGDAPDGHPDGCQCRPHMVARARRRAHVDAEIARRRSGGEP